MRNRGYSYLLVTAAAIVSLEFAAPGLTGQTPVSAGRVEMVPVLGHSMRVRAARLAERRPGQPIVVLEGGAVQSIDTWDPIFDRLAEIAPVIAYDRRGIGRSEFDGAAQTLDHVNESLHALLTTVTASPPYLLVGHSYGGVLIRAFARKYPTEVAGLVYLDAPDTA